MNRATNTPQSIGLNRAGLCLVEGCGYYRDVRPDHGPVDRGHDQDGEGPALKLLPLSISPASDLVFRFFERLPFARKCRRSTNFAMVT